MAVAIVDRPSTEPVATPSGIYFFLWVASTMRTGSDIYAVFVVRPGVPMSLAMVVSEITAVASAVRRIVNPRVGPPGIAVASSKSCFGGEVVKVLPAAVIAWMVTRDVPVAIVLFILLFVVTFLHNGGVGARGGVSFEY